MKILKIYTDKKATVSLNYFRTIPDSDLNQIFYSFTPCCFLMLTRQCLEGFSWDLFCFSSEDEIWIMSTHFYPFKMSILVMLFIWFRMLTQLHALLDLKCSSFFTLQISFNHFNDIRTISVANWNGYFLCLIRNKLKYHFIFFYNIFLYM